MAKPRKRVRQGAENEFEPGLLYYDEENDEWYEPRLEDLGSRSQPVLCAECGEYWPCSVARNRGAYRADIATAHRPDRDPNPSDAPTDRMTAIAARLARGI